DQKLGPKLRHSELDLAALRGNPNIPSVPIPTFGTPACEASGARCSPGLGAEGVFKGDPVTMTELTTYFSRWLDRPVSDRTGLTGSFEVELQFSFEGLPGASTGPLGVERPQTTDNPSIFTAVQEQLGLKLQSTRGPVEVLVIDHAEKPT